MNLNSAKALAVTKGYRLIEGFDHGIDLQKLVGGQYVYIDTLHSKQIDELKSEDFTEFYLNDEDSNEY